MKKFLKKGIIKNKKSWDHVIPPKNMILMPYKTYAFTNVADLADFEWVFMLHVFG